MTHNFCKNYPPCSKAKADEVSYRVAVCVSCFADTPLRVIAADSLHGAYVYQVHVLSNNALKTRMLTEGTEDSLLRVYQILIEKYWRGEWLVGRFSLFNGHKWAVKELTTLTVQGTFSFLLFITS